MTLSEVSAKSKEMLTIFVLGVVGLLALIWVVSFIRSLNQPPPAKPTVAFGKLPEVGFPQSVVNTKFSYNIQTISGSLPVFPDRETVYKMQQTAPSLLALQNATTLVNQISFTGTPTQLSESEYQWVNTDTLPKTLTFNIFTNNFMLTSDFMHNSDVQQGNNLPDQNTAISTVNSFLVTASLLPNDIDASKTKATLLAITNGQLLPASSLSTTQVIEVDLFQNNVHGLPVFYPDPTHSTMNFYVAGGDSGPQIVQANFVHQGISGTSATYPIITAKQALTALENNQGYIASYDGPGNSVTIYSIQLGYYMGKDTQNYLMPIVVFEGDNNFFAYVPAVSSDWIQSN